MSDHDDGSAPERPGMSSDEAIVDSIQNLYAQTVQLVAERAAEYDELRALVEWDVANDPYDTDHFKRWLDEHPRGESKVKTRGFAELRALAEQAVIAWGQPVLDESGIDGTIERSDAAMNQLERWLAEHPRGDGEDV